MSVLTRRSSRLARRYPLEAVWVVLAIANYAARLIWPSWETVGLHVLWLALTLVVAFRLWPGRRPPLLIAAIVAVAVASVVLDAAGVQLWTEALEVPPLMAALFFALAWQTRRREEASQVAEERAAERAGLLERQERFVHDASHELRTPVTIARGHLELLLRHGGDRRDLEVALTELQRIEQIVERLLLIASAGAPGFVATEELDLEPFLEEVLLRFSEVAPRAWRLGPIVAGKLEVDGARLRAALDALLENAIKYSSDGAAIELRAGAGEDGRLRIEVEDEGIGVPEDALEAIFERFARGGGGEDARAPEAARTPGVGLGLSIVDAIVKSHGGRCYASRTATGSVFAIELPGFTAASAPAGLAQPLPALSASSSWESTFPAKRRPEANSVGVVTTPARTPD